MNPLPITLTAAGAAALVNFWLSVRVGQVRTREKVSIGDGGNEAVIRRMRAHSNYIENAPFFLILVGAIELAKGSGSPSWLWPVVGIYFVGRVLHALGMDDVKYGRMIGTVTTMVLTLGLAIYAIILPHTATTKETIGQPTPAELNEAEAVPQG